MLAINVSIYSDQYALTHICSKVMRPWAHTCPSVPEAMGSAMQRDDPPFLSQAQAPSGFPQVLARPFCFIKADPSGGLCLASPVSLISVEHGGLVSRGFQKGPRPRERPWLLYFTYFSFAHCVCFTYFSSESTGEVVLIGHGLLLP